MGELTTGKANSFWGELRPPSDKSLTHRAYIIGAICRNGANIETPLRAEDCDDTLAIIRALGARIEDLGDAVRIFPSELAECNEPLYCGNSGTTMRLLMGMLAGAGIAAVLTGDESLSRRPMRRVAEPLRSMGAQIEGDNAPIHLGSAKLHGIDYNSPIASAQIKSAILLAGLFADGTTSVSEPAQSRDHTERMLSAAGCKIEREGLRVSIEKTTPTRVDMKIPADISSAAFFLTAGLLVGGPVTCRQVGINPTRTGFLEVLGQIGANVKVSPLGDQQGEPVGDIVVEKSHHLPPFRIDGALVPRLIDEIPILAVLGTQCEGTSIIKDAAELRVKESDRIEAVASALKRMGANVQTFDDGMAITGPTRLSGAEISAHGDHRIAMAFAVAGLIADGETRVLGADTIATSFPSFEHELSRLSGVS